MGKPTAYLGVNNSGHSCYPPSASVSASSNVLVNKKGALRVGDSYVPHCCPKPGCHTPVQAKGSGTVIVNGKQLARLGDATACGAVVVSGSGNVLAGG